MQIIIGNSIGVNRTSTLGGGGGGFSNTKSLAFDGVDESISVFDMPVLNTATELTFSFWGLKASGNTLGIEAFSTSTNRVILYWWQDDNVYWNVRNGSSSPASSNSLGDFSNWHHFAGTYNGATGTIKLYLDGSLVNTQTGAPASTSDLSSLFTIGISNNTNYNTGNIDEVAIFDSELNSDNINDIYNGGTPNDLSSLSPVLWYRMGDGDTYPTLTDNGSGGNDGTMINMEAEDIVNDVP